jgi:hypothetical protein
MSKSRLAASAIVLLAAWPFAAHAIDTRIKAQLLKLDPKTRLEQACDTEAMIRIRDDGDYRPDKVIAYTFRDPVYGADSIKAPGAVFRSKGEWYHLSYSCETGPKHVHVRDFAYEVGNKISRESWSKYYLYD